MVSIQRLAPVANGEGKYVSTKMMKQYAAVVVDYQTVQRNTPGYMGRNCHKVYGTFTFFDTSGKEVGNVGPNAEWEVSVSQKGKSLIDRLPDSHGVVVVKFSERQGTGEFAGKTFNQMDELDDEALLDKIVAHLEAKEGATEAPAIDGPPEL